MLTCRYTYLGSFYGGSCKQIDNYNNDYGGPFYDAQSNICYTNAYRRDTICAYAYTGRRRFCPCSSFTCNETMKSYPTMTTSIAPSTAYPTPEPSISMRPTAAVVWVWGALGQSCSQTCSAVRATCSSDSQYLPMTNFELQDIASKSIDIRSCAPVNSALCRTSYQTYHTPVSSMGVCYYGAHRSMKFDVDSSWSNMRRFCPCSSFTCNTSLYYSPSAMPTFNPTLAPTTFRPSSIAPSAIPTIAVDWVVGIAGQSCSESCNLIGAQCSPEEGLWPRTVGDFNSIRARAIDIQSGAKYVVGRCGYFSSSESYIPQTDGYYCEYGKYRSLDDYGRFSSICDFAPESTNYRAFCPCSSGTCFAQTSLPTYSLTKSPSISPRFTPTAAPSTSMPSIGSSATFQLDVSTDNSATILFTAPVLQCGTLLPISADDFDLQSSSPVVINQWTTSRSLRAVTFKIIFIDNSEDAPSKAITMSNKVNHICEAMSAKILFPTLQSANLTLVHPTVGSEFGNTVVTIHVPFSLRAHVAMLQTAAHRSSLRFPADSRTDAENSPRIVAQCRFGPAVHPNVSFQFPIRTAAQLKPQSDSISCLSASASPLLPYNTEAFRDVDMELWLDWSVTGFNASSSRNESLLLSSELYGTFTFEHADPSSFIDQSGGASSIFSSTPVPNYQFTLDAAATHEMVANIDYVGVNATRGELLDLTALLDYCILDNGSALVTFNDFVAINRSVNGSSMQSLRDSIATELYMSLGAVTGHIKVLSLHIGSYVALRNFSVQKIEDDAMWCRGAGITTRSALFTKWFTTTAAGNLDLIPPKNTTSTTTRRRLKAGGGDGGEMFTSWLSLCADIEEIVELYGAAEKSADDFVRATIDVTADKLDEKLREKTAMKFVDESTSSDPWRRAVRKVVNSKYFPPGLRAEFFNAYTTKRALKRVAGLVLAIIDDAKDCFKFHQTVAVKILQFISCYIYWLTAIGTFPLTQYFPAADYNNLTFSQCVCESWYSAERLNKPPLKCPSSSRPFPLSATAAELNPYLSALPPAMILPNVGSAYMDLYGSVAAYNSVGALCGYNGVADCFGSMKLVANAVDNTVGSALHVHETEQRDQVGLDSCCRFQNKQCNYYSDIRPSDCNIPRHNRKGTAGGVGEGDSDSTVDGNQSPTKAPVSIPIPRPPINLPGCETYYFGFSFFGDGFFGGGGGGGGN